jgi:hypothetical protein
VSIKETKIMKSGKGEKHKTIQAEKSKKITEMEAIYSCTMLACSIPHLFDYYQ